MTWRDRLRFSNLVWHLFMSDCASWWHARAYRRWLRKQESA